jgi:hypothetical protein
VSSAQLVVVVVVVEPGPVALAVLAVRVAIIP